MTGKGRKGLAKGCQRLTKNLVKDWQKPGAVFSFPLGRFQAMINLTKAKLSRSRQPGWLAFSLIITEFFGFLP
jgi:hypothetical protein